jgi:hypothetical protein
MSALAILGTYLAASTVLALWLGRAISWGAK